MHTFLIAIATLLLSATAAHADTFWIADSNAQLGTRPVAPGIATPTTLGPLNTSLADLAWDNAGNLWGVGGLGLQHLFSVNPVTGNCTDLGDLGTPINSLGCAPDGTLYGAYNGLWIINTGTATATPVGPLGFQASGDLAFVGAVCYITAADPGGFSSDVLITANTTTGAGSLIGPIGATQVYGLATGSDGTLYAGVQNHIITLNTATGAGSPYASWPTGFNGSFGAVTGLTLTIPEPASLALLTLGTLAILRRRRH